MEVTKVFELHLAHRLQFHKGLCRNLHGHTYKVEVTFTTNLFHQSENKDAIEKSGMIEDFGNLKASIESGIGHFDHSLVLDCEDPLLNVLEPELMKSLGIGRLIEMKEEPTAENMAILFAGLIQDHTTAAVRQVRVWETPTSYATYTKRIQAQRVY